MTTHKVTKFTKSKRGVIKSVRSAKITKPRPKGAGFYSGVPHFGHSSDEEDLAAALSASLAAANPNVKDLEEAAEAMAEPRARAARQKGQLNFEAERRTLAFTTSNSTSANYG